MSNVEIIGSTNLIILLEDEVFVDFFNTFLSLPVFGQTPFYTVENAEWSLWPEIPHDLISEFTGFLTWLGKYRLPFFCKTNLCFHYILCQELISFIHSPEGAHMMGWKRADQWLLQKCIGGVRGMWRFCTYLKGSAGEELVDFWILAEKILSIDEMDLELRDHYLSLLLVLRATHLKEGSRVVTLCNMNIKSFLNLSVWHPNQSATRRETLTNMQKVALFKIQSYWLPNFYTHAKTIIAKEESCQGLMQEYETRLCSICCAHEGELPVNMSIRNSHHPQKRYSSRKTKRKMWRLIGHASWSLELDTKPDTNCMFSQEICPQEEVVIQMPPLKKTSSTERGTGSLEKDILRARKSKMKKVAKSRPHLEGLFETKFSAHLRTLTPIISHYPRMTIKKAIKQRLSIGYTHWALCADACAGGPFRDHLKKLNLGVELRLLDLWHDLHHFLSVQMTNRKTGNSFFWHMLGNRICELYLNEQIGPCLPLKSQTIRGLKELLPSGDMNPWILRAQEEICQMLSSCYDEFLDQEDHWFLTFSTQAKFIRPKWHKREPVSKKENILLYKRFEESLALSQGLANMEEMESMQWRKLASEDLRQGGSLQVELPSPVFLADIEKMPFEELCYKYPKVAIEKISDDYKIYCEKAPEIDLTVHIIRKPRARSSTLSKISFLKTSFVRKPSLRPRNLTEVLLNPQQLEFFAEFLRERKAESALHFLVAVQKMSTEADETVCRSITENIMKTFFYGKLPPEEMLQCDAPIVREIAQMRRVSAVPLLALQDYVMKSLEVKWFKEYQDLFPAYPQEAQTKVRTLPRKPSKPTSTQLHTSQKKCWQKMISFIKSFCKYRRFISDVSIRPEFEEFLYLEIHNSKENLSPIPKDAQGRPPAHLPNIRSADENEDAPLVKRRIFGHRIVTVNFAMNDLYFFSEIQKFNDLVRSAHVLQVNRAYNENDVVLMKAKLSIILNLYLQSEVPPKLKVNISEAQKDSILSAISEGRLDRSIFHGAIMSLFPIIMYFWKRFCIWRAARSYLEHRGKELKDKKTPPKVLCKYPSWSGGEYTTLRFSLLRGYEWLRIQQRDVMPSSVQNSSSSNLTQPKPVFSTLQLGSASGLVPRMKSGVISRQRSQTDTGTTGVHLWEQQVRKTMGDLAGGCTVLSRTTLNRNKSCFSISHLADGSLWFPTPSHLSDPRSSMS
ncbi:regulator of G-protein signaling protein-like [Sturnira hondurensis]|uniref:regulator of G-protein signaling protein-like n=1 Tax=Sturnira hondurensis TaxID=192404 RepID=UPI00187A63EB|nr:regulator of G-protein signaling protein-like [Sturnira hondurensis]